MKKIMIKNIFLWLSIVMCLIIATFPDLNGTVPEWFGIAMGISFGVYSTIDEYIIRNMKSRLTEMEERYDKSKHE